MFSKEITKKVLCASEKKTRDTRADRETDVAALPLPLLSPHLLKPSGLRWSHYSHGKKLEKKRASKKIPTRGEKTGVRMSASKGQATSLFSLFFSRCPFNNKKT